MIDYSLESLEKKFAQHMIDSKVNLEEEKKNIKELWPDNHYEPDEFCLPEAILMIVKEIILLKLEIKTKSKDLQDAIGQENEELLGSQ